MLFIFSKLFCIILHEFTLYKEFVYTSFTLFAGILIPIKFYRDLSSQHIKVLASKSLTSCQIPPYMKDFHKY